VHRGVIGSTGYCWGCGLGSAAGCSGSSIMVNCNTIGIFVVIIVISIAALWSLACLLSSSS